MKSRDMLRLSGVSRGVLVAAVIGTMLAVGACGKRGALQGPQVTTGVDEEGKKIKVPAPKQDLEKPFILDPLLL